MNRLGIRTLTVLLSLESSILFAADCTKCRCTTYPVEKSCEKCCILGERFDEAAQVLKQFLSKPNEIPKTLLDHSACVLVFPNVKKVGVGLGATYGRGVLVCRTGPKMDGGWGAPAMTTLDVGSLGVQLGELSTDYVILIPSQRAAVKILSGGLKLGADAAAVAGPTGAKTVGASRVNADLFIYSRAKGGLFAGASLGSASIELDNAANEAFFGKSIDGFQIVSGGEVPIPASADQLLDVLRKASPYSEKRPRKE
jgi:SH3 domain-containing YSC84-like protein 1